MPKFGLFVVGLIWLASVSVVIAEPVELEERKQIHAIMAETDRAEYGDRTKLPEVLQEARQRLADLNVSEPNRSTLLQARTLNAVVGQHWDDFSALAKNFNATDPWVLQVKTWQLQARVTCKEWQTLAKDVTWLIGYMENKTTYLANTNDSADQMCYQILRLRRAVCWPEEKPLIPELQSVASQIDRLEKSHAEIPKGVLKRLYDQFEKEYEWIPGAIPQETALTGERWKALIADQETIVASATTHSKSATRKFSDLQGRSTKVLEGMKAEKEHYAAKQQFGNASRKLSLWLHLATTADSQVSMTVRAGLWTWEMDQQHKARSARGTWIFNLEQSIAKEQRSANEHK